MKTLGGLGILASVMVAATGARASDVGDCIDGAANGQTMRDARKLVEAKALFLVCSRPVCPPMVQSDCANWLEDVNRAMPTIVISVRDEAGADLTDVRVSVNDKVLTTKLEGQAFPVNPGRHTFAFQLGDGTRRDREIIIKEGEKDQAVNIVLGKVVAPGPDATPAVPPVAPAPAPATAPAPAPAATPAPEPGSSSPWRTVGWVTAGVGAAGLVFGTVFGFVAIGDTGSAHCNANNYCDAGPLGAARSAATLSDVGFIAGGLLAAGGVALVLLSPGSGQRASTARVSLTSLVGSRDAGVAFAGAW